MKKLYICLVITILFPISMTSSQLSDKSVPQIHSVETRKNPLLRPHDRAVNHSDTKSSVKRRVFAPEVQAVVLFETVEDAKTIDIGGRNGFFTVNVPVPGKSKKLLALIQNMIEDQPLTSSLVDEVVEKLQGWFDTYAPTLTYIMLPRQDLAEGVIRLVACHATLGKKRSIGNVWFSSEILEEYLRIQEGEIINQDSIERNLAFLNRNPFRQAYIIYTPGREFATTDIELKVHEIPPVRFFGGVNNSGLEATGQNRLFLGFNAANVTGLDEVITYQFTSDTTVSRFKSHMWNLTLPIPYIHNVFSLYGLYATVDAKLDELDTISRGSTFQLSSRYTIPLPLVKSYEHEISCGLDIKKTDTNLIFSAELIPTGRTALITNGVISYKSLWDKNYYKGGFEIEFFGMPGPLLSDQTEEAFSSLRPGAKPRFYYAKSRIHSQLDTHFGSFHYNSMFQYSPFPLLSLDQMSFGGVHSIRGFNEGFYTADSGLLFQFEWKSTPLSFLGQREMQTGIAFEDSLKAVLFADYGIGYFLDDGFTDIPKARHLLGVGPGLIYKVGPFFSLEFDAGFPFDSDTGRFASAKYYYSVVGSF